MIRGSFQRQKSGEYYGYITMPGFQPSSGFHQKRVWGRLIPQTCRFEDYEVEYLHFEADV